MCFISHKDIECIYGRLCKAIKELEQRTRAGPTIFRKVLVNAEDPVACTTERFFRSSSPMTSNAITDFPVPGPPFTITTDFRLDLTNSLARCMIALYAAI
jgi:hypothetical protein